MSSGAQVRQVPRRRVRRQWSIVAPVDQLRFTPTQLLPEHGGAKHSDQAPKQLLEVAEPVLRSHAFARLRGITFLGALSPQFDKKWPTSNDGTRAEHSLGVAKTALDIACHLGLSTLAQRYAVAWGLTHDIATWPFSHTSEPAFERITGVSARALREKIVLGDRQLPSALRLDRQLRKMSVEPNRLMDLFRGSAEHLSIDLQLLSQVIRSRLTPDTLEGIWRSGVAYNVDVPSPASLSALFSRNLFEVTVSAEHLDRIEAFWVKKSYIYERHINSEAGIRRDSIWSHAIGKVFAGISLQESMELSEDDVRHSVRQFEFPNFAGVDRYKPPHVYRFCAEAAQRVVSWAPLTALAGVLLKVRPGEWQNERK